MSLLAWPDVLPLPLIDGYEIEPGEGVNATDMEAGPARQRLVYTQVPDDIRVRWLMTSTEYGVFESWYRYRANRGAVWFTMPLSAGLGIDTHEVRFIGQVRTAKASPIYWRVSATLQARDKPLLTEGTLDLALAVGDLDGLIAASGSVHTLVHTTMPAGGWT